METWTQIPNLTSKTCFGCGPANPHGLQMVFFSNGQMVQSKVTIPEHLVGWASLVHGGVISTVMDEVMAWTVIYLKQSFILTKTLTVDFLKPIQVQSEITAKGWISGERTVKDRTECTVAGELYDADGILLAKGEGKMPLFTKEAMLKLNLFDPKYILEFDEVVFGGKV